jgi:hypothetical protein
MMCIFARGIIDGKAEADASSGVVETGCEESAESCKRETFSNSGGEEAAAYARSSCAKGDETQDQVPFDQKEAPLGLRRRGATLEIIDAVSHFDARSFSRGWASALLVVLAAVPLHYAHAQSGSAAMYENSITVYGGYRFGGSVTDTATNSTIDLENDSSFALAADIGLDPNRQIEIFYSQQHTALTSGVFSPQANNIGLTLYNYQIGGTAFIEEVGRGLYVMGGIGGTTAKPDAAGLNSETFFSGNLGVGWMVPLAPHVGVRFEARGYGILLNNSSALFCGGRAGCTFTVKGNALFEGEVLAGLSIRF